MLEYVAGRDRAWLLAHGDDEAPERARIFFDRLVAERARGVPVPYLTGNAGFYGRRFDVTRDVLVPRPETEHLIERALDFLRCGAPVQANVCDAGTGSGIIAVTLALELPEVRVVALDISPDALAVAERNARLHEVAGRIVFHCSDVLAAVPETARFDCIVANLPYVRSEDLRPAPDPTAFEPRLALDGGAGGLEQYSRLLARAPRLLAPGGAMFLEAGPDTAERLATLVREAFEGSASVRIERDYAARERVVELRREA